MKLTKTNQIILYTSLIKDSRMENLTKTSFEINLKREDVPAFVRKLVKNKIDIFEIKELEMTLEEAFLKKAGGNKIV